MNDGTGKIKFATTENTYKFYWKNHEAKLDYPSTFIGVMTPSIFKFTKMSHLYDIMELAFKNPKGTEPIIACGNDEYTAVEFLKAIRESRMWTFDRGL